jgi:hypothetical protein
MANGKKICIAPLQLKFKRLQRRCVVLKTLPTAAITARVVWQTSIQTTASNCSRISANGIPAGGHGLGPMNRGRYCRRGRRYPDLSGPWAICDYVIITTYKSSEWPGMARSRVTITRLLRLRFQTKIVPKVPHAKKEWAAFPVRV